MLEFALLIPITLAMFFGTMDFSRVFYAAIKLANAAQAGALYGAQSVTHVSDTAGIKQAAVFEAQDLSGMTTATSNYCQYQEGVLSAAPPEHARVTECREFTSASPRPILFIRYSATPYFRAR